MNLVVLRNVTETSQAQAQATEYSPRHRFPSGKMATFDDSPNDLTLRYRCKRWPLQAG